MKKKKILSILSSALLTGSIMLASFPSAANAYNQTFEYKFGGQTIIKTNYKTNDDLSETVITEEDNNRTAKFTINSNGMGTFEETINEGFCISAKIDNNSKLPENIQIDSGTIFCPPVINGDFLCFDDGKGMMTLEKAKILAEQLHNVDGISNIQIYQTKWLSRCHLMGNTYRLSNDYEFDINDFTEIIEKGFEVSLIEEEIEEEEERFFSSIYIIPPDGNTSKVNYQGMLAAMEIQESKGIELSPEIYCECSVGVSYDKFSISGDLNNDYAVNVADIVILQRMISNKNITASDVNMESADVNNDGEVNVFDAVSLKRKLLDA